MQQVHEKSLKTVRKPGFYRADTTLYLKIRENGGRSWVQRLTINGKRKDIGLGGYPLVDVIQAKEKALANRRKVYEGGDPTVDKRRAKVPTFRDAANETLKANEGRWRSKDTAKQWQRLLNKYVHEAIGDKRVDQVTREYVLRILEPIWTKKPSMARKVRQHLRVVFERAQGHGYIDHNPAGDMVDGVLRKQPSVKAHMRAMSHRDVPAALDAIVACDINLPSKLCLQFIILTACRGIEARGATWAEIDKEARLWTIPANRMKAGKEHDVPLSDAAIDILKQAEKLRDGTQRVFPSVKGKELAEATLLNVLKRAGLKDKGTVHGFRSSFRSWCAATGEDRELAEMALAHSIGDATERSYKRTSMLTRRADLMNKWAAYLTGPPANLYALPQAV